MGATRATKREVAGNEPVPSLYDRDFYAWTMEQAEALRSGRDVDLDTENLAEEVECLGKEQFNKLQSHLRIILLHMLKWDFQPARRSRSWTISIVDHRYDLEDVLSDNPSLRPRLPEAVQRAYRKARLEAADETNLKMATFPVECPYELGEIVSRSFDWPEA